VNTDKFLLKNYDRNRYNCLHFTRDVWLELTGVDITDRLQGLLAPEGQRKPHRGPLRAFKRLRRPVAPCIVYMRSLGHDPHVGVLLPEGLLHIRNTGPELFPFEIAVRGTTPPYRFYQ